MHYRIKLNKGTQTKVVIPSAEGLLEGRMHICKTISPIAIIFHPHPLHGGTMNNKVVTTLTDTFQSQNFNTLRINFRGVGKSQGTSVGGEPELEDALNAIDWFIQECEKMHGYSKNIWVAGFSFGGWVALQAAMRRPEITGFVAVGTPVESYSFNMLTPCPNGLMLQATNDHIVSIPSAQNFHSQIIRQKGCIVDFEEIDTDHYFTDNLENISNKVVEFIEKVSE